jgi:hypothetical protein
MAGSIFCTVAEPYALTHMNPPPSTDAHGYRSVGTTATTPCASGEGLGEGEGNADGDGAPVEAVGPVERVGVDEGLGAPFAAGVVSRAGAAPDPHAVDAIASTEAKTPISRNLRPRVRECTIAVLLASATSPEEG